MRAGCCWDFGASERGKAPYYIYNVSWLIIMEGLQPTYRSRRAVPEPSVPEFVEGVEGPPTPTFLHFLLDEKVPKNQGRHQGPATLGGRSSPMSAIARAPSPDKVRHSHTENFSLNFFLVSPPQPLRVIARRYDEAIQTCKQAPQSMSSLRRTVRKIGIYALGCRPLSLRSLRKLLFHIRIKWNNHIMDVVNVF